MAIVLGAAVGGYAAYHILGTPPTSASTLTIWAYDGLFGSGTNPNQTRSEVFGGFSNATGTSIHVVYVSGDLAQALIDAKPGQRPDLVMGLDELEAPLADKAGLLVPYISPELSHVNASVIDTIAPDHTVTPYEYGYLGLDYNASLPASMVSTFTQGDFFQGMATNPALAKDLYYPDPVQGDITGEEFLAWEVEYYTNVLHQNWTTFWTSVAKEVHPVPDWSTCWNEFTLAAGASPTCLSYTSDPATEAFYGAPGWMNTSVVHEGGKAWSWMTVYGTGIVQGTPHLSAAEKFVDWTLGTTVQSLVPTNEWMYPASNAVSVPSVYDWTIPPSTITPVNQFTTPQQSASDLTSWVLELAAIQP